MIIALLFITSGILNYWNAWLFIFILFVPMLIVGNILHQNNVPIMPEINNSVRYFKFAFTNNSDSI